MRKNILNLDCKEANNFFLNPETYARIELPMYFTFDKILENIANELKGKSANRSELNKAKESDNTNHFIYDNKDGRYAWRKIQLLNPYLYISLTNLVTREDSWSLIRDRFKELSCSPLIRCMSIPVTADLRQKQIASQVAEWVEQIEKESIRLALDFEYLFQTDITNCYGSIYTHSVAWALHSKLIAKEKRDYRQLLGNKIDHHLQAMSNGQTNGVPQGSILMDFLAEIVLAYADSDLFKRIDSERDIKSGDYRILRYRDDYRIFVRNPHVGERIMKLLGITLAEIGMSLNTGKTKASKEVIRDSIKPDKFSSIQHNPLKAKLSTKLIRDELLLIYKLGIEYPNSGSVNRKLTILNDKVEDETLFVCRREFISILINIAFDSPRSFPIVAALISRCLTKLSPTEKKSILDKLLRKISLLPNSGILEIWLQRITVKHKLKYKYNEILCKIVDGEDIKLFNTSWIDNPKIKEKIENTQYVDNNIVDSLDTIINKKEVELFAPY